MSDLSCAPTAERSGTVRYCERCARRSPALFLDPLSSREVCRDCLDRLTRLRGAVPQPTTPGA